MQIWLHRLIWLMRELFLSNEVITVPKMHFLLFLNPSSITFIIISRDHFYFIKRARTNDNIHFVRMKTFYGEMAWWNNFFICYNKCMEDAFIEYIILTLAFIIIYQDPFFQKQVLRRFVTMNEHFMMKCNSSSIFYI